MSAGQPCGWSWSDVVTITSVPLRHGVEAPAR